MNDWKAVGYAVAIVGVLAFWAVVIYVIAHFITKFW